MSMTRAMTIASLFFSLALHGAALFYDAKSQGPLVVLSQSGKPQALAIKLKSRPKKPAPTPSPLRRSQLISPVIQEIPLEISDESIEEYSFEVEEVNDAPTLHAPQPQYPRIAQLRGHEGFVRVRLAINGQGHPISADLIESSGYQSLDQAALRGLMLWRFHATHNTAALGYWTEKVVEFRLE
jgi:TonB family protein